MTAARIIFALYIVILTTLPCVDIEEYCHLNTGSVSLCPLNSHSQEHSDTDCCSPFCVCNCCQVNVVTQGMVILQEPCRICMNTLHAINSGDIQEVPLPFWQPPKVALV